MRFDRWTISRRQLLEQAGFGLGSLLLMPPSKSFAAEETLGLPPIFSGDASISDAWRKRLEHQATKPLVDLLLTAAEQRLADPLPAKEVAEMRAKVATVPDLADPAIQHYIAVGLAHAALFYYPPLFALAYQLSREARYKQRALEWLDVFLSWPSMPAGTGDIQNAYAVMGTVLAARWLGDEALGEARRKAFVKSWTGEGAALIHWEKRVHSNNHYWLTNAGLGFLVATHPECFQEPQKLLDTLIRTFRESVAATFSEEGEYNDGLVYALKSLTGTFLFAHALWDRHRIRLFDHPQLRAFVDFCLDTTTPDGGNLPGEHEVIPGWNWLMGRPVLSFLAANFRDEQLQARLRGSLGDTDRLQRGTKLWFWFRRDLPNPGDDPKSCSYWHGVFDLMWLNPEGPAEKPFPDGPRYSRYKHTGVCIARDGQLGDKTLLCFRAGTASQKDLGDHNGFVWYPAGRRVLDMPRSNFDAWRDDTVNYFKDWNGFFANRAGNVILVDGVGQHAEVGHWDPQGDREWLERGKVAPTSQVVSEEALDDGIRWVGEAQGAYPKRLKLWRRTIELRNWLSLRIQDRVESVKADAKIDWLLHTQGIWKGSGKSFTVTYEGVRVDVEFRAPATLDVAIEETPAGQGNRRTSFLRATTKADKGLAEFDVTIKADVAAK